MKTLKSNSPETILLANQIRRTKPVIRDLAWRQWGVDGIEEGKKPTKVRLFKVADFSLMAHLRRKGAWVVSDERTGRAFPHNEHKSNSLESALDSAKYWMTTIPFKVSQSIIKEKVLNTVNVS